MKMTLKERVTKIMAKELKPGAVATFTRGRSCYVVMGLGRDMVTVEPSDDFKATNEAFKRWCEDSKVVPVVLVQSGMLLIVEEGQVLTPVTAHVEVLI